MNENGLNTKITQRKVQEGIMNFGINFLKMKRAGFDLGGFLSNHSSAVE